MPKQLLVSLKVQPKLVEIKGHSAHHHPLLNLLTNLAKP